MLVFIDESGDLGFKKHKLGFGSTRFFTIALVVFENGEAALACQQAIEDLRSNLGLSPSYEFHFHDDSHETRLALLSTVAKQAFTCYTFTLDKASTRLTGGGFKFQSPTYKWVCKIAIENAESDLQNATVVIDGSGERAFRRQIKQYLRREINGKQKEKIREVRITRSCSDPLIQLADYVASITNRFHEGKAGADIYDGYLRRKRRSLRKWP